MAQVNCTVEEVDAPGSSGKPVRSVCATCTRCGHQVSSFGTHEKSIKRCLAVMSNECPRGERNYYVKGAAADGQVAAPTEEASVDFAELQYVSMLAPEEAAEMRTTFSPDQERVVARIVEIRDAGKGGAFLLTGQAGSGKTYVLKYLCGTTERSVVTATTGIAAQLLGGCTIHSFIGLGRDGLRDDDRIDDRMRRCGLLVVDEVSMMDVSLLQAIHDRCVMAKHFPIFVFSGDFLQLPPVQGDSIFGHIDRIGFETLTLTAQHRQDDDGFVAILNDVREGILSQRVRDFIYERTVQELPQDCTNLTSRRDAADQINQTRLANSSEQIYTIPAAFMKGEKELTNHGLGDSDLTRLRFPVSLRVRVGARVVLLKNTPPSWVNGSTGRVLFILSRDDMGKAYDFSTDEEPEIVAAPVSGADGNPMADSSLNDIAEFERPARPRNAGPNDKIGEIVVLLDNGNIARVTRADEELRGADGKMICKLVQFPMTLAWALTSHKAQGMSLDRVGIDLNHHFATGQTYTALSRARHPEGVFFRGYLRQIKVDYAALEFFRRCVAKNQV